MKEVCVLNKLVCKWPLTQKNRIFFTCLSVFRQTGWNHKAIGKGSREKDCGVCYPEHMKQSNSQMCSLCFIRKF